MPKESASQFLEAAAQHITLREHFHSVAASEEFIEVAEKLGYIFTTEELKEALKEHSQGVNLRRRTGVWLWLRNVKWL